MAETINPATLSLLRQIDFDGCHARLHAVAPELYRGVAEVLARLGGVWRGGRTRAHVFQEDPAPLVRAVVESGVMPPRNPDAFFATPAEVARGVLVMADLDKLDDEGLILEPQAGSGALADYLCAHAGEYAGEGSAPVKDRLYLVERSPLRCRVLREKGYARVHEGDFLEFNPGVRFARILMNPPFSVAGDRAAYVAHILHAFELLDDDGILVAVAPDNFIRHDNRRERDFLDFVTAHGYFEENEPGAFKESGTGVPTVTIALEKTRARERERVERTPHDGYLNYYCFLADLKVNNEERLLDEAAAIHRRLDAGELHLTLLGEPGADARAAIEHLYARAVTEIKRGGSHMRMTPEWMGWLVESFMEGYEEHRRETGEGRELRARAA
jgi:predicted RNA methylase